MVSDAMANKLNHLQDPRNCISCVKRVADDTFSCYNRQGRQKRNKRLITSLEGSVCLRRNRGPRATTHTVFAHFRWYRAT